MPSIATPTSFTAGRALLLPGTGPFVDSGSAGTAGAPPGVDPQGLGSPAGLALTVSTATSTFTAATVYYWVVTGVDDMGNESSASNEVNWTAVAGSVVTLTWQFDDRFSTYNVYRGTAAGAENVLVGSANDAQQYALGAAIPNRVVAGLHNASSLVSKRWIIPNADPYHRRAPLNKPSPVEVNSRMRRVLLGQMSE
jgi:hypothetical protein